MGLNIRKQSSDGRSSNGSGVRVGKTRDGRYVPIQHPDAVVLAYTEHDEVPSEVLAQLGTKQAAKPADKSRRPRSNKRKSADTSAPAEVGPDEDAKDVEGSPDENESSE